MALSWNEIQKRAIAFSKEWEDVSREHAEAKSFWDDFFHIFGISRRRVATFEEPVKKLGDKQGFIDLFWKGQLIVEHKSKGKDLDSAYEQALEYFHDLKERELPKYVLVSDFARFRLYDLEEKEEYEFELKDLHKNIKLFGFIAGYKKVTYGEEDPVNIKAAEIMGALHDRIQEIGYTGSELEVFLVRLLFCLFGEDTGIFEKYQFTQYIEGRTNEDGSDVGSRLSDLFQVLDTPSDERFSNLDEELVAFPYVNGKLFEKTIRFPSFDSKMREALLEACYFDWSKISPAIFGSMFQSVMDQEERRNLGAHYTSEKNIMKVIKPLFLDELHDEFNKVKSNKHKLDEFHTKLSRLKFLDPACGSGNFLIITYRELRLLEIEILKIKHKDIIEKGAITLDVEEQIDSKINVDQFYGIEIEEWPAKIAEVAMWLIDHQMNVRLSEEFGQYFARLPLKKAANIVNDNALKIDWEEFVPKHELNYILGNPPFIGHHLQTKEQKELQLKIALEETKSAGVLDFVTNWFVLASRFIRDTKIKVAFVATNSISQGEQVNILWKPLIEKYNMKINFAHRTFRWDNEAKGKAAVHVVIVGFANFDTDKKYIYEYDDIKADPHEVEVKNINPYLVDANNVLVINRRDPISDVPKMVYGNKPTDGGHLIFHTQEELKEFLDIDPRAEKYVKEFVSAREYLNNDKRWCLWLVGANPSDLKNFSNIRSRIEKVREFRLMSKAKSTRDYADFPHLFRQITQPTSTYILVPRTTSENRRYIPFGFINPEIIISDTTFSIANASTFHFGVLTSELHMTWMRYTAGRLKSDYRYSKDIVYNNFPWSKDISDKQKEDIEEKAQAVLDTREKYPDSSLADLYDPITMPPDLVKAHKELDRVVDKAYRSKPFKDEKERIEFLFELYEEYLEKLEEE